VVLVDAAEMGLEPGLFRRVPLDKITDLSIGTHASDLTTFILYIRSFVPEIIFIGIQPKEVRDLPSPTVTVKRGVKRLKRILQTEGVQGVPIL
jgi:hydrogenase 3 maturation protease